MRGMTKTSKKEWRRLIAAQEKSGLTVRDFAKAQGINVMTLYWWRSRLRREGRLVPVEVVDEDAVPGVDATGRCFEVQFDGTMTLLVPANFDEAELRRIIRALRC
jgi:transposase-like protein